MAYVNVAEWKPDQVSEWLKGLDSSILPYLQLFLNNQVNGQQLLNVRSEDLDNLGVKRLGHQELILEAVEHLRNFHYELDRENLQLLALRLSCQAHSLHNELCRHTDSQPVSTQTLADVASVVRAVKPLVCWLDRSPFSGQLEYADRKSNLLKYSLEIATCAQRDRFAERPVEEIRTSCGKLADIADGIIQDIADPLVLQPASLDLATLRKRGVDDLGFFILPSFHGVHQIGEIKFGSPAHQCGKVEEGDEVVQVNYQTVVGWQRKKVMALFEESVTDVFLTLKKRPRHTKVYGQIYMKPYRLPSKKRAPAYTRWHDSLPSPRPELLTIPDFEIRPPRAAPKTPPTKHITLEPLSTTIISTSSESDVGSGCDEASIDYELEGHASPTSMRLYLPKPRVSVQRRATITGASPASHLPPVDLEKFLREFKLEKKWKLSGKIPESHNSNPECRVLRNKSPCEQNERPSTCLGFEKSSSREYITKRVDYIVKSGNDSKENLVSSDGHELSQDLSDCTMEQQRSVLSSSEETERTSLSSDSKEPKTEKRFITKLELTVDPYDSCIEFTQVSSERAETKNFSSIQKKSDPAPIQLTVDDSLSPVGKSRKISTGSQVGDLPVHRERGRLDKSFSTPAYDLSGLEGLGVNSKQKSPPLKFENMPFDGSGNELPDQHFEMPDLTSSAAPGIQSVQDYPNHAVFKFPAPSVSHSHTDAEMERHRQVIENDNSDVNSNPVSHGRVVETINRHLLDSNCGKGDIDDCIDICDISRSNPGLSRTMTNIVLNSPDLISDITTHRFYPKPVEDFENGNHFHLKSPKLDNCDSKFDFNQNSAQIKLLAKKSSMSKTNVDISEDFNQENDNTHLIQPSVKGSSCKTNNADEKGPPPTPPACFLTSESSDQSSLASQHPKIPVKILVNPPDPPPRPNPPSRCPLIPSEPHKSLRAIISNKSGNQRAVFGSPKISRKKNPLLAKRRSVGVKELGIADYQGWLYRRLRIGDSVAQWIKGWFILKGTTFYGFKTREAHKADCFISLPGFTTSPAEEVKSRKFAFKVYHTGTVFYFAAESEEELAAWMDCLSMATFALDVSTSKSSVSEGPVFSETEDEGDDDNEIADSCFPSPKMRKFTNFLSGYSNHPSHVTGTVASPKPARSHQNLATSCESKTYDIQKKFGSLKKLGYRCKHSNQLSSQSSSLATSLAGSEQSQDVLSAPHSLDRKYLRFLSTSKSQNVPVPTAQFRSYRRVVATDHCPPFPGNPKPIDGSLSTSVKVDGSLVDTTSSSIERFLQSSARNINSSYGDTDVRRNNRSVVLRGDDTAGLLTLEQFMLQRQEEEHHQNQLSHMSQHQDRLRERDQERDAGASSQRDTSEGYTEDPVLSLHKSLEKRRTPPPAPPSPSPSSHQQPTVRPVPAARTILSVPNAPGDSSLEPPAIVPRSSKPSGDLPNQRDVSGSAMKQPLESLPETPRRTLIPPKQPRLKNAAMYQPPPLAFPPSPSFGSSFEMHLDHGSAAANLVDDGLDSSRLKGTGSKIRQFLTPRRGHFQTSQGQCTPLNHPEASVSSTHRTLLGSPRLHHALFRQSDGWKQKNVSQSDSSDNSSYSPTTFGSVLPSASSSPISSPDWALEYAPSLSPKPTMGVAMLGKKPTPIVSAVSNISSLAAMSPPLSPPQTPLSPPPDYPGLEYPPVFEPGIYSLSDTSTLLSQSSTLYSPSSDTSSSQLSQR